jgi:hypothetical protein
MGEDMRVAVEARNRRRFNMSSQYQAADEEIRAHYAEIGQRLVETVHRQAIQRGAKPGDETWIEMTVTVILRENPCCCIRFDKWSWGSCC